VVCLLQASPLNLKPGSPLEDGKPPQEKGGSIKMAGADKISIRTDRGEEGYRGGFLRGLPGIFLGLRALLKRR